MTSKPKWSANGFGFFIQLASIVFIILLTLFTQNGLEAVTQSRIEDCASRIASLQEEMDLELNYGATEDEVQDLADKIEMYEDRIVMLQNRDLYYGVSMGFLCFVLFIGAVMQYIRTASFPQKGHTSDPHPASYGYYTTISAPLCAVCILLAIGVSYRMVFSYSLFDLLTLVAAVLAGAAAFLVYRHYPYISARLEKNRKKGRRFSDSDIVFFIPVAAIVLLLLINLLFGGGENSTGARLWVSVFGISVQPGEFVKVLLMVVFATSYGRMWRALVALIVSILAAGTMILLHDLGSVIVIFAMVVTMCYLLLDNKMTFSLYDNKKLVAILLLLAVCASIAAFPFLGYARERITNVGSAMELGGQQADMLKALVFGGVGGLGLENSSYLINIFAIDSDMAIAGITSLFGIGMLLILLLCYALLIVIPIRKAAVYRQSYFVTAQVSVVLFSQVLLNALGSVDVLPFTGIVAPFLSNGGSALVAFCVMIGLVLATLHPVIKPLEVTTP